LTPLYLDGLDPHQARAVPWLIERPKAMLAWEMGVGKTAPLLRAWENTANHGPCLVLCLASARENWAREARKFAIDRDWPPRVQVIRDGTPPLDPAADVTVCNYDKLLNTKVMGKLRTQTWGALILDEAHVLKTVGAARTRLVYGPAKPRFRQYPLIDRAARVWLATGTPMPNHPGELYSHAAALWPECMQYNGHLMAEWEFQAAFCEIKQTKYGMQVVGGRVTGQIIAGR
jgi:SWI/SNF-related matrix-associated actin-dependent regulator of chromatin subfamily A-like protein 1